MQVIIFPQDDNKVSVVYPAPEYADQIEAVAAKDVPSGKPWRIVEVNDLPQKDSRNNWRWTNSGPLSVALESPVIPAEVSRFQAKAALSLAGKLEQAEAVVQASTDPLVKLAWAEALVFRRDSPSINGLASAIGLSSQDLDNLFIQAATIVA